MKHLDLFSGIGGFAYAADQVWGSVEHVFCDNDKFCRAVLRKHWPESEIYDDIRKITANPFEFGLEGSKQDKTQGQGEQPDRERSDQAPFLLTGGFPCQSFSQAGLRRGTADERYLWPEMFRVIRLAKPEWVIAENVRGLVTWQQGVVLEQVCSDLEAEGYEVQPLIIPACAVNAPHRRDRIWFIAHATHKRSVSKVGLEREPDAKAAQYGDADWERNWSEVAAELCSVDDGLLAELGELKLTKAQHRDAQIKAYGNAIVPQVAMEIMRAIKEAG